MDDEVTRGDKGTEMEDFVLFVDESDAIGISTSKEVRRSLSQPSGIEY